MHRSIQQLKTIAILAVLIAAALARPAAAGNIQVIVNTTPMSGVNGSLEFQYNSNVGDATGSAVISNFSGGTLVGAPSLFGNVSGNLVPGPMSISNAPGLNDVLQNITFGQGFSYDLSLSGTGTFAMTMWNGSWEALLAGGNVAPLAAADASGAALWINVVRGEIAGITAAPSVITPEPTSLAAFGLTLSALAGWQLLRRRPR